MPKEKLAERLQSVYGGLMKYAYDLQFEWGYHEPAEARDLVQETCLKIIKRPDNFRGDRGASFYSYAAKVLKNTFDDQGRRKQIIDEYKKSLKEKQNISKDADGQFRSNDIIDVINTNKIYVECFRKLTDKQYRVFFAQMSTGEDKKPRKNKDLSKLLGIPLGTLEPLLVRAKTALGKCLKQQFKQSQEAPA